MAHVEVTADRVRIQLTPGEKVAGLRGDLDLPRTAIRAAQVVPDGPAAVSGLRAPGLAVPRRTKIGTWRGRGSRSFAVVRRGQPTLCLSLTGERYDRVLVSTPDAADLATALS
ncbi:hypothetical protein AB0F81_15760 [Actinoplanes sp. NPDC024001]|uniref:hypothetical protein n=1 Tax=Actinoplanes sp. NPDC024001 TaxID=3154598 RepID=UPI0033E6B2E2